MQALHRRLAWIAAGLVVLSVLAVPSARALGAGSAAFSGFTITPIDSDGSGRWDTLLVNFTADVGTGGLFEITVFLNVAWGPDVTRLNRGLDLNLTAGSHPISMAVDARFLGRPGATGPYALDILVQSVGPGLRLVPMLSELWTTPAWSAQLFDPPAVSVSGSLRDWGVDPDRDSFLDALVVRVPLRVTVPTTVSLTGVVGGVSSDPEPARALGVGLSMWNLTFDGLALRSQGTPGPFEVSLDLSGPEGTDLSFSYLTHDYAVTRFAGPPVDFRGLPTLERIDTNGNGKAEFLRVHVPLRVWDTENVTVTVEGGQEPRLVFTNPDLEKRLFLGAGSTTVDMDVSGIVLSRLQPGLNVSFLVTVSAPDLLAPTVFWNRTKLVLPAFDPSAFESRPPAELIVNAGNACQPQVWAVDPVTRYSIGPRFWRSPVPAPLEALYNGTFVVLVEDCWGSAAVARIVVRGDTRLNLTLPGAVNWSVTQTVKLGSWTMATVDNTLDLGTEAAAARWWADFVGNLDGDADAGELARLLAGPGAFLYVDSSTYFAFMLVNEVPRVTVTVDGSALVRHWSESILPTGFGLVTGTGGVTLTARDHLRSIRVDPSGDRHNLTVDVRRDDSALFHRYPMTLVVHLPYGASGNATLAEHLETAYGGFDFAPHGVAPISTAGTWRVSFAQPDPFSGTGLPLRLSVAAVQVPGVSWVSAAVLAGVVTVTVLALMVWVAGRRPRKKRPRRNG